MTFWASKHIPHLMIFKDIFHNPHTQYIPVSNDILSTKIFSTYFKQGNSTKLPLSCLSFSSKIQCGQLLGLGNILIIDTTHITIIVIIVTITLADHSDQSKYSVNRLNWTKISANPIVQKRNHCKDWPLLPDLAAGWLSVSTKTLSRTTTYQTRLGSSVLKLFFGQEVFSSICQIRACSTHAMQCMVMILIRHTKYFLADLGWDDKDTVQCAASKVRKSS